MIASKKRIALAWYIDVLLFGTIASLISLYLFSVKPAFLQIAIPTVIIEYALRNRVQLPGLWILSTKWEKTKQNYVVNQKIKSAETTFTMLIGIILIDSGAKMMLRWTTWNPPYPDMVWLYETLGYSHLIESHFPFYAMVSGLISILIGVLVLKLTKRGLQFAILFSIITTIQIVLAWDLFDEWVRGVVLGRQEWTGVEYSDTEQRILIMQAMIREVVMIINVLTAGYLIAKRKIFTTKVSDVIKELHE